jgi:hypothetical protein
MEGNMRRIATIAATAAAAAAAFALAAPANAATTNTGSFAHTYTVTAGADKAAAVPAAAKVTWHNWSAHSVGEGSAYGTYAKVGKTVYVYGRVHDSHTDTYRVCIKFTWYLHGKVAASDGGCIVSGSAGTAKITPAIKGPTSASSMYNQIYIEKGSKIVNKGKIHKIY